MESALDRMIERLDYIESLGIDNLARDVLSGGDLDESATEQIRSQLMEGKDCNGNYLHPFYLEDIKGNGNNGYFASENHARAYMLWKQESLGQDLPKIGAPNLTINGTFHNSLYAEVGEGDSLLEFHSSYKEAIMEKYGVQYFAPNDEWIESVMRPFVKDGVIERIKDLLDQ